MVSTAAFHARVRGSVPGLGGLKETKLFLPHPRVKVSIVGSLRDREVACSASDRQGSDFESCVWRTVSSQSSHHPQEVLLAQFSLYVHKGGLKPDSFHFCFPKRNCDGARPNKSTISPHIIVSDERTGKNITRFRLRCGYRIRITIRIARICTKLLALVYLGPRTNPLRFGDDPDTIITSAEVCCL